MIYLVRKNVEFYKKQGTNLINSNTNGVHIRMFDAHILCGKVFLYRFDWPINRHLERKRSNIHRKRRETIAFFNIYTNIVVFYKNWKTRFVKKRL